MGCGMSTEDKEGKARNEEIENQLKRDKMMQRNEIKMLLLGRIDRPLRYGQISDWV
jgi:guanine nucleotide-binding protein subunit alpha